MGSNAYKRYKKTNKKIPGIVITPIIREQTNMRNALRCNEDTIIRTEIHGFIMSCLEDGMDKEDIISGLSANKRYEKYAMRFEGWVTDQIKKKIKEERHR